MTKKEAKYFASYIMVRAFTQFFLHTLFPILALVITGPFILHQYHKFASIEPLKTIIIYGFIFYLLCAYFLVILPLPKIESVIHNPDWMIQIIPFHFVIDFIKETPFVLSAPKTYIQAMIHPSFYVVFFNILLFVPFGMFLRYYKGYSRTKELSKLNFPWSSPSKFPASQTK